MLEIQVPILDTAYLSFNINRFFFKACTYGIGHTEVEVSALEVVLFIWSKEWITGTLPEMFPVF